VCVVKEFFNCPICFSSASLLYPNEDFRASPYLRDRESVRWGVAREAKGVGVR
jgi:hypothetical protein